MWRRSPSSCAVLKLEREAAAHFDDGAVEIARFVGSEKSERVGDFLRLAEAAHRHFLFERVQYALRDRAQDARRDEAGTYGVGAYPLAAELAGPRLDHTDH